MRLLTALLLAAALALAACGGSSKSSSSSGSKPSSSSKPASSSSGGGATVKLSASKDKIAFSTTKLSAKAGKVTIAMANPGQIPHAIAVEGHGIDKDGKVVTGGGTSTVSVKLKPGTYTFYCPVDSHEQQGMKGTLTVR
jgi:plastocyanin